MENKTGEVSRAASPERAGTQLTEGEAAAAAHEEIVQSPVK